MRADLKVGPYDCLEDLKVGPYDWLETNVEADLQVRLKTCWLETNVEADLQVRLKACGHGKFTNTAYIRRMPTIVPTPVMSVHAAMRGSGDECFT